MRSSQILRSIVALDDEASVVRDELESERTDRGAGVAAAGRRPRHIQQAVREVEVTEFNKLDEPLRVPKRRGVHIAENRVPFEFYEAHGRREPLADERGQFTNDLM